MTDARSDDFIDIFDLVKSIWQKRTWIIAGAVVGAIGGGLYATFASPEYAASAVISSNSPRSAFSEMMGSALPIGVAGGGGASVLEARLKSRSISERVAALEPDVAKKLFSDRWDDKNNRWEGSPPSPVAIGGRLRGKHLTVSANARSGLVDISVILPDSVYAKKIVDAYVNALKASIQENTAKELEDGLRFLDEQAVRTTDPTLLAGIRDMQARNLQRATFNNPSDFQVIEYPSFPAGKKGPQFSRLTVMFGLLGGVLVFLLVICHYLASAMLSERRRAKTAT